MRHLRAVPERRSLTSAPVDELTALAASASLSHCELDESAWIVHCWLRAHCAHGAVAIVGQRSGELLSQWTSPAIEVPPRMEWAAADAGRALARPVVAASGGEGSSSVTIFVALERDQPICSSGTKAALQGFARVIAARISCGISATDTAPHSLAHAVAAERDRLTDELTSHFAEQLEAILLHLRRAAVDGSAVDLAATMASQALVDLRDRRPLWQQAGSVEQAFAAVEREIGELAAASGIRLECALAGRPEQVLADVVLDAAAWITRAGVLNVLKHSEAARGRVTWSVTDDELVIAIADDGCGFEPQRAVLGGLRAMRRRAEILGGSLQIESAAGWGTQVRASLRVHAESGFLVDESASALVRTLGDRELDVLRLVAVGHRNREIATELDLSQHTVKFHLANIFGKLGVRSRAEAAAVAFAAGVHPRRRPASGGPDA
jgi:signal transduction histidine kinase/DNA-binding CsgD family transcriptional regulator